MCSSSVVLFHRRKKDHHDTRNEKTYFIVTFDKMFPFALKATLMMGNLYGVYVPFYHKHRAYNNFSNFDIPTVAKNASI